MPTVSGTSQRTYHFVLRELGSKLIWRKSQRILDKAVDSDDVLFIANVRNWAVVAIVTDVLGGDKSRFMISLES